MSPDYPDLQKPALIVLMRSLIIFYKKCTKKKNEKIVRVLYK